MPAAPAAITPDASPAAPTAPAAIAGAGGYAPGAVAGISAEAAALSPAAPAGIAGAGAFFPGVIGGIAADASALSPAAPGAVTAAGGGGSVIWMEFLSAGFGNSGPLRPAGFFDYSEVELGLWPIWSTTGSSIPPEAGSFWAIDFDAFSGSWSVHHYSHGVSDVFEFSAPDYAASPDLADWSGISSSVTATVVGAGPAAPAPIRTDLSALSPSAPAATTPNSTALSPAAPAATTPNSTALAPAAPAPITP